MANSTDTVGQLFRQPRSHAETVDPDAVTPPPPLSVPAPVPFQPAPALRSPDPLQPLQAVPPPTLPSAVPLQDAPPATLPTPVPVQRAPSLRTPDLIPTQAAPALASPAPVPTQEAPPLSAPVSVPTQGAPPLSLPAETPLQGPPSLSVPSPAPSQDAPALRTPDALPPPPVPQTTLPVPVPLQDAPLPSAPSPLPPPPAFAEPAHHADLVAARESAGDHTPGLLGQLESDLLGALGNIDIHNQAFVTVPGVGVVPIDFDLNTHGDKINAGIDVHVAQVARQAERNALTYAKAKAEAGIAAGLRAAVQSFGVQKSVSVGSTPGTGGPLSPVPASLQMLGPLVPLTFGPTEVPAAVAPDNSSDPANTYLQDATLDLELERVRSAGDLDQRMSQAAEEAQRRGQDANLVAGATDQQTLLSLFRDRESGPHLALLGAMNAASGSDNRQSVSLSSPGKQEVRGYFPVTAGQGSIRGDPLPTDDGVYLPLVFTDLRPIRRVAAGSPGAYRSVYFRPFIKSLSEAFAPGWAMSPFFGRVDKVATYQGTDRTIQLAFKLACFGPEDLEPMYQKLGWLTSMVYPQFEGSSYFRGPVVRMRVGDIVNAQGNDGLRGVPGVITSLNLDYGGSTWELDSGQKLPREADITLAFHVLHEHPIGLVSGHGGDNDTKFGGIRAGGTDALGRTQSYVNVDRFRAAFGRDYLNDPNTTAGQPASQGLAPLAAINRSLPSTE